MSVTALRVVATLAFTLIVSQFYRTAVSPIAPEVMRDLSLTPEQLGLVTSAFFITFAAMQIPVGMMLDRFGPRRTVSGLLLFAVLGALQFAHARDFGGILAGQLLLGLGCSGVYMGGLVAAARWFPADRFATIAAFIVAFSNMGTLLSATPLLAAVEAIGWRDTYTWLAVITGGLAALVLLSVRDAPADHPFHARRREGLREVLAGTAAVFRDRRLLLLLPMAFVSYPAMLVVRALWAGPYLADVHGLDGTARGDVILYMSMAVVAGILFYGPLDRRFDTRKWVVVAGTVVTVGLLTALALLPEAPLWLAAALLVAFILCTSHYVLIVPHGKAFFPERLVGRTVTAVNLVVFVGVAALQSATGILVGAFPEAAGGGAPEIAYRAVFAFLALCMIVALALYLRSEDVKPSEEKNRALQAD
ncbi:MAG: MFS transporter [Rhodospirillaceae bacterium]|jgi:MFS family permease|nr:MFS transporter [Rhodospirillaceae bacterium]